MGTERFTSEEDDVQTLYNDLADEHLQPLWELTGLLTHEPAVSTQPFRWSGRTLKKLAARSGELIPIDRGGDRRVLACANPGLQGAPFATSTMWAAVQFLNPSEGAPPHRHTPAALRFVLEGEGAWTLVDGDPLHMATGDLVLTPSMTFHEHHNPGAQPMMWMDVLDLPMVAALDAVFFEEGPTEQVDTRTDPLSSSEQHWGGGPGLSPVRHLGKNAAAPHSPLLAYRWADTDRALSRLLDSDSSASETTLRFTNPFSGGDVMPTMRCQMQRVLAGNQSAPRRQTGSQVCAVLHGNGVIHVGNTSFPVESGDIVVIPSWHTWQIRADAELDLFSVSDAPVLESLGLYRETAE
ncbi:cupin domain-containing protein [Nocardioides sp. 1609]|uniref:cupin domain-containing protein n=1 Tax=Nocardioides sp. 1609 TaxID=2508327 RepID=UPI0010702F36|nr:cupin domain-containing protein [Nocardioides sp. 1609]